MSKWVLTIAAEDGQHVSVHGTRAAAAKAFVDQAGPGLSVQAQADAFVARTTSRTAAVDDWGRRISLGLAPFGISTARQMEAYRRAFDARECGVETAAQRKLLAKVEG